MDKTAAKWKTRFNQAEEAQQSLFARVNKYYDIMYAVQNTSDMAPWRAKVYIPILASKAWDLISRLSNVTPWFQTKIDDIALDENGYSVPQETIDRQRRLDAKLRKDYLEGSDEPIKLKMADVLADAVIAGTGWAKVSWEVKDEKVYSKQTDENGMVKNPDKDKEDSFQYGCNSFDPTNFFNVFVAPNSPSWAKAPYMIARYFKPFYELENNKNYNLDDLKDTAQTGNFDSQNSARNRIVNEKTFSSSDTTVKAATIYECYERKADGIYLTTYAEAKKGSNNGWIKIRGESKKYWHKYYPLIPFYIRKKTFSPFGESLFENNATLQAATNDIFNHYLDNLNVSLDSMIMYEDGTLTSDFIVEPGGEITYTGEEPKQFKFPEPNPAQISQVMSMLEKAVEVATVPQYISGIPDSSTDKTAGTAKGISLITEAATEKIGFMKDNVKQSMTIVGRIMLSNLAQFMDKPSKVEYPQDGEMKPDLVTPADYQGKIELQIDDDSMLPLTKDERRDIFQAFITNVGSIQKLAIQQAQFFQDPQGVPKINFGEMIEDSANFYAVKDVTRYMTKADAPVTSVTPQPEGGGPTGVDTKDNPLAAVLSGLEGAASGGQSQFGA
jgi:hypothetical protein